MMGVSSQPAGFLSARPRRVENEVRVGVHRRDAGGLVGGVVIAMAILCEPI